MKPLAIDLFCGLGGWTEGLLDEGYEVVGFDVERHVYGDHRYQAQLVLQDVLTIDGAAFKDAALIVASPPCQAYSYRAIPWKRAKALPPPDNSLFDACFRIQREACEAAGRRIPMVVENVRGAQKWVGRARCHYGSFYLWGDVPALMPFAVVRPKVGGISFSGYGTPGYKGEAFNGTAETRLREEIKNNGGSWFNIGSPGQKETNRNPVHDGATKNAGFRFDGSGRSFQSESVNRMSDGTKHDGSGWRENGSLVSCNRMVPDGSKVGGDWFGPGVKSPMRKHSSKSPARKAASAMIARIPLRLARHIASVYFPRMNAHAE